MMYLRSLHICHLIKSKIKLSSGEFSIVKQFSLAKTLRFGHLETLRTRLCEVWNASDAYNDLNTVLKNKITIIGPIQTMSKSVQSWTFDSELWLWTWTGLLLDNWQNNVADAPEIFVEQDWVHAGEGQTAVLMCRVLANPPAKVRHSWSTEKFQ